MPVAIPLAIGIGVAGVAGSIYEQSKANSEQQQALNFQEQQANLQATIQQRQAIRSSRAAYADSQQQAANQGVGDSSASQGGLGSITSQLNSNLSFLDQNNRLSDAAGQALGKANQDRTFASDFSAVGSFAESTLSNPSFTKIFH